ncbi:MAG: flagellar motor stator protein MotA [Ignavibacteriae bacterium HGW-Ignavibacteriae-3]|nr:MAG: flagellar motor stator protein MotA [Ignavibacteriae bacterium HGW-Ignavibacteriae-3]
MFVIIGIAVVTVSVLLGFMIAGGNPVLLIQISEFITIGGAVIGSVLIASPLTLLKKIIAVFPEIFKNHKNTKEDYSEMLKSFCDLFLIAQREGLLAIEKHVENPDTSEILGRNKKFITDPVRKNFFCDTMKVMLAGSVPPHEMENLMDAEIETFEKENKPVIDTISRVGDSLPGLGIVAAVLGIIVTMASINQGAEAVGHHVAAALVGTFLGVLLAYGFINPMSANLALILEEKAQDLTIIKTFILAYAKGNPPFVAAEISRRTIFSDERPSFSELEAFLRGKKE